jgi:hypothetical protein
MPSRGPGPPEPLLRHSARRARLLHRASLVVLFHTAVPIRDLLIENGFRPDKDSPGIRLDRHRRKSSFRPVVCPQLPETVYYIHHVFQTQAAFLPRVAPSSMRDKNLGIPLNLCLLKEIAILHQDEPFRAKRIFCNISSKKIRSLGCTCDQRSQQAKNASPSHQRDRDSAPVRSAQPKPSCLHAIGPQSLSTRSFRPPVEGGIGSSHSKVCSMLLMGPVGLRRLLCADAPANPPTCAAVIDQSAVAGFKSVSQAASKVPYASLSLSWHPPRRNSSLSFCAAGLSLSSCV